MSKPASADDVDAYYLALCLEEKNKKIRDELVNQVVTNFCKEITRNPVNCFDIKVQCVNNQLLEDNVTRAQIKANLTSKGFVINNVVIITDVKRQHTTCRDNVFCELKFAKEPIRTKIVKGTLFTLVAMPIFLVPVWMGLDSLTHKHDMCNPNKAETVAIQIQGKLPVVTNRQN
jgi:hypothetical protein